jgi:hypothetical protein
MGAQITNDMCLSCKTNYNDLLHEIDHKNQPLLVD